MIDGRTFLLSSLAVFAASGAAKAQQTRKVYRIGFLGPANASSWASYIAALRQGLRELGYEESKNLGPFGFDRNWIIEPANSRYSTSPSTASCVGRLP